MPVFCSTQPHRPSQRNGPLVLHHVMGHDLHKWLSRRDRQGVVPWTRFNELLGRHPLPPVRIPHGYAGASESRS